uniref:Uncharacterized protein n=1 Tax=Salvator merianae TaxID=96440 RepID=A0A8D0DSE5_SALMN
MPPACSHSGQPGNSPLTPRAPVVSHSHQNFVPRDPGGLLPVKGLPKNTRCTQTFPGKAAEMFLQIHPRPAYSCVPCPPVSSGTVEPLTKGPFTASWNSRLQNAEGPQAGACRRGVPKGTWQVSGHVLMTRSHQQSQPPR